MYINMNKKYIKILEQITIELKNQEDQKDYTEFYSLVDKIKNQYNKHLSKNKVLLAEKRKLDPTYAKEYWYKLYRIDKEKAKQDGKPFTKKCIEYKQEYYNKLNKE